MAIYHCSIKSISRGAGQSIVASAAYRHACMLENSRTGEVYNYSRKQGVESSDIYLPSGVNQSWAQDRSKLWNAAEAAEKRKDARLGREIVLALPAELSASQRRELIGEMACHLAERYGVAVDVAIHQPSRQGDQRNHHAHMLISSRRITSEGFAEKTRELDDHERGPAEVEHIRNEWARLANRALERAGQHVQIDHRSFRRQELKRMPSLHLGPSASAMERRGILTRLGDRNRAAQAINARAEKKEQEMSATRPLVPATEIRAGIEAARAAAKAEAEKPRIEAEVTILKKDLSREEKPRIKAEKALKSPVQSRPAPAAPARGLEKRIKQLSDEDHADLEDIKVKFWERQKRTGGGDWKKCINFVEQYGIHGITLAEISKIKLGYNDFIKEEQKKCDEAWRKLDIARKNLDKYENDNFKIVKLFSKKGIELKLEIDIEQQKYNISKNELENKELCKYYVEKMQEAFLESEDYKKYKERKDVRNKELKELKKVKNLFSELAKAQVTGYTAQKKITDELIKQWEQAKPEQQEEILKNAEKTVAQAKELAKERGISR